MSFAVFSTFFLWQAAAPAQAARENLASVEQKLRQFSESVIPELLEWATKDRDPAVRRVILVRVSRVGSPRVREALERHASADPDPEVAPLALERLRLQQAQGLGQIFGRLGFCRQSHR